jgi:basic amino acid/polyamine antiporter, APA family
VRSVPGGSDRRLGLLEATALNMSNMIGIGPFITIPLLMSSLGGPQSMFGWLGALVLAAADGMIWSELGAMMPGSGGSFVWLREAFGRERYGRLAAFLFIWQFVLSGPLEIASGYIGLTSYLGYLLPDLGGRGTFAIAASAGVVNVVLLYRGIRSVGRVTLVLWIGTLATAGAVLATGAMRFDPAIAFDSPRGTFVPSLGFFLGLGAATRVGVYDYLGYYDVCFIGDEVRTPGRVIPRSILLSIAVVALLYFAINLSIVGVVPWREFVPAPDKKPVSDFVVSIFMERTWGKGAAAFFTLMVVWTAFGSVFALLLGYSRIPYAAAKDGYFFASFARLHPKRGFPFVSLLAIGAIAIAASTLALDVVIDALITTRILIQFVGQIAALILLRRREPDRPRPYRVWLYPLPCAIALAGWTFVFATSDPTAIAIGIGTLALGVAAFFAWARRTGGWPFAA